LSIPSSSVPVIVRGPLFALGQYIWRMKSTFCTEIVEGLFAEIGFYINQDFGKSEMARFIATKLFLLFIPSPLFLKSSSIKASLEGLLKSMKLRDPPSNIISLLDEMKIKKEETRRKVPRPRWKGNEGYQHSVHDMECGANTKQCLNNLNLDSTS
jgi:hypothetical protein